MEESNITPDHIIALSDALKKESKRVRRWLAICIVFAVGVSALVAVTRSFAFLAVALFAWFFVWNRWRLRAFLQSFLLAPSESQHEWLRNVAHQLENPPRWYKYSEYLAAVTFFALYALITVEVTARSGIWMRALYAVCWLVLAASVFLRIRAARQKRPRRTKQIGH